MEKEYMEKIIALLKAYPSIIRHLPDINSAAELVLTEYIVNDIQKAFDEIAPQRFTVAIFAQLKEAYGSVSVTEKDCQKNIADHGECKFVIERANKANMLYYGLRLTHEGKSVYDEGRFSKLLELLKKEYHAGPPESPVGFHISTAWWPIGCWKISPPGDFMALKWLTIDERCKETKRVVENVFRYIEFVEENWDKTKTN